MDWDRAIERNREALKRIVASLVALAGLAIGQSSPLRGRCPAGQRGVGPETTAGATRHTLPRHLHRAVLRLLRPVEAAARRLVIVFARGLVVELSPARPRKPKPDLKAGHAALRGLGIAVVISPADMARAAAEERAAEKRAAARAGRQPVLPLFDPPQYPFRIRRRTVTPHAVPRILSFVGAQPHRLPPPLSPNDPIDASHLVLRFQALASALDDLPKHARRFARWKMRRDRGLVRRISPLRPGRPPGLSANSRRSGHEIHDVLADLQHFAREALKQPDTS